MRMPTSPAILRGGVAFALTIMLAGCGLSESEIVDRAAIGRANVNKACVIACHSEINVCPAPQPKTSRRRSVALGAAERRRSAHARS